MNYEIKDVLANGQILGTVCKISNLDLVRFKSTEDEINRFKTAVSKSVDQINSLKSENKDLEDYLAIQELMILDPDFNKKVVSYITDNRALAKEAIEFVMNEYMLGLADSSSTYLQERVADLEDASQRIISNLINLTNNKNINPYILVVDKLYPTYLISNRDKILGIIAKSGGYTSHAAILCRTWDIPYVIADADFNDKDIIIIDTGKNLIIQNPNSEEVEDYTKEMAQRLSFDKKAVEHADYLFLANVSSNLDLQRVIDYDFDGVGLYRTEMIFMNNNRPYTFNEQYEIYKEAVDILGDKFICFRTFDVGDDKQVSYLKTHKKGIDNYKNNPIIFIDQVKAMLKANIHGNMRIMFPMIETKEEFLYLKRWVLKIREEHGYNMPKIGMMLETKEALEHINDFQDADFISIGTNDLTQELYHINRESGMTDINKYLDDLLEKLKGVVSFCNENDICLSVCGELASVNKVAMMFYNLGIKNLSVAPSAIRMLNLAYSEFKKNNE